MNKKIYKKVEEISPKIRVREKELCVLVGYRRIH